MKPQICIFSMVLAAGLSAQAQVTFTGADMFNEAGLYYEAYANSFDPTDPTTSFPTGGVMGQPGGPQLWDFTTGPTDVTNRFDYLVATNVLEAASFPNATLVERKMDLSDTNSLSFLMFTPVKGVGRTVYGFYDANFSSTTPANVFSSPIVDFPDQIHYNDSWQTSATITTTVTAFGFDVAVQETFISNFKVDAYGTVDLPGIGFGDVLRVNEQEEIDTAVDNGDGTYTAVETDYTRNYYWLRPGYGIVAQMNSTQSSTIPANNYDQATSFLRMFMTNKKPAVGCTGAMPVTDLGISYSSGKVLLKWTATQCTSAYRIEYTPTKFDVASWLPLTTVTNQTYLLETINPGGARFYRVVSMP